MMNNNILRLTPARIFCPLCGDWHEWDGKTLGSYNEDNHYKYECGDDVELDFWVDDDTIYIQSSKICDRVNNKIDYEVSFDEIECDAELPVIKFAIYVYTYDNIVCSDECSWCNCCNLPLIGDKRGNEDDEFELELEFKFEFASRRYFDKYAQLDREEKLKQMQVLERTKEIKQKQEVEQENKTQHEEEEIMQQQGTKSETKIESRTTKYKEDITMKKTNIWEQLYEKSPKENIEIAKQWAEKYKPTLKWAIPVVCIYGAYRILNSKDSALTVENIDKKCKNKLGFSLDYLKDKKVLGELMALGGLSAGAYAAIKGISAFSNKEEIKEISVEDVEKNMDKLETTRKKFGWIQSKTEALLPVAVSVIIVYVMTQKPAWFEKIKDKFSKSAGKFSVNMKVYSEMVKLFVADKLHIDMENEEDAGKLKKFAFLAVIVGIGVILYGRKVLGEKEDDVKNADNVDNKIKEFIGQILSLMKKLMPTAFAGISTFLITKKVLKVENDEFFDSVFKDSDAEDSDAEDFNAEGSDEEN